MKHRCDCFSILGENQSEEAGDVDEKITRDDGFSRAPEIDFCYETKARKVMVDFKFDALYRYVSIESLLKSGE